MRTTVLAALLCAAPAAAAPAATPEEAGRAVWERRQDAVVGVRLVVEVSVAFHGQDRRQESKTETVGTVVDPSGLTVVSLAAVDPSAVMKPDPGLKVETEVKEARIVLADGSELPAKVALRDPDIDAAFVRPLEKQPKPLAAVGLAHPAVPRRLDLTVCLNRLGKVADRVVTVSLERIDALVSRPRPFYVLSPGGSSGVGSPVFSLAGEPVGVILIRSAADEEQANVGSMFSGTGGLGFMPVVVPASDVQGDVAQALAAQ